MVLLLLHKDAATTQILCNNPRLAFSCDGLGFQGTLESGFQRRLRGMRADVHFQQQSEFLHHRGSSKYLTVNQSGSKGMRELFISGTYLGQIYDVAKPI